MSVLSILALEITYLAAISFVWSRGTIFRWLRTHGPKPWVALADCPLCSGFWIGVMGHAMWIESPVLITWLGIGSIVGTCALVMCAAVRRL